MDSKVQAIHRARNALVYVRQSTFVQVEKNRESALRQYDLSTLAQELGWCRDQIHVIDERCAAKRINEQRDAQQPAMPQHRSLSLQIRSTVGTAEEHPGTPGSNRQRSAQHSSNRSDGR